MTNDLPFDAERALHLARETFAIEADALLGMQRRLTAEFARAVETILRCEHRVVVMGMGKSGHVGRKIAATLASTGTPSFFVHPAEAAHGDLGMVTSGDVCLLISNSGESSELSAIIPALRRLGVTLVALTGRADSSLAKVCDIVLSCAVDKEACTLDLAPTASTTAQMAMGDALAVALLDARGFREEDFAMSHPGGALGRKLLTHVSDLMRTGDGVPRVARDASFSMLLQEMSGKGLGLAAILRPTWPLLPMPMTTTRCSQRRMVSTARANSAVSRRCMPRRASASIWKVWRARCNARSASNGKSFVKVGCLCSRMGGF